MERTKRAARRKNATSIKIVILLYELSNQLKVKKSMAPEGLYTDKPDISELEKISEFLDNKYRIPGTRFRFGLDPIIGLIPGLGDAITMGISGLLVVYMARYGVSRKVVVLMVLNVIIDGILGSIPLIGWLFDFAFKANEKNIRLLKKHYHEGKYQGSGTGIIISIALVLFVILALIVWALFELISWLLGLI